MRSAFNYLALYRHSKKLLIQFLSLALIVSTLSAVSIAKASEVAASNPGEILRFDATNPDSYTSSTTWIDLAGAKNGSLMNGTAFNSRTKAFDFEVKIFAGKILSSLLCGSANDFGW